MNVSIYTHTQAPRTVEYDESIASAKTISKEDARNPITDAVKTGTNINSVKELVKGLGLLSLDQESPDSVDQIGNVISKSIGGNYFSVEELLEQTATLVPDAAARSAFLCACLKNLARSKGDIYLRDAVQGIGGGELLEHLSQVRARVCVCMYVQWLTYVCVLLTPGQERRGPGHFPEGAGPDCAAARGHREQGRHHRTVQPEAQGGFGRHRGRLQDRNPLGLPARGRGRVACAGSIHPQQIHQPAGFSGGVPGRLAARGQHHPARGRRARAAGAEVGRHDQQGQGMGGSTCVSDLQILVHHVIFFYSATHTRTLTRR
jgi:hypothetical protein